MNETTEIIMRQLNSKKTHAVTHEVGGGDEIDALKLKNIGSLATKDEVTRIINRETDTDAMSRQAAVDADGFDYQNLKTRLDAEHAQLAQKVTKGEVSVFDIDKNKGKFDQTYMSDEFLQQMVGNTPINAVSADRSIILKKLTFNPLIGKLGKNLFDKTAITPNAYLKASDGTTFSSEGYHTSDYIKVNPSTLYFSKLSESVVFYDANKTFISQTSGNKSFTTPANGMFLRFSAPNSTLDLEQVESGGVATSYEEYGAKLDDSLVHDDSINGSKLKDKSLALKKLTDYEQGKNLFNKETITSGVYLKASDGTTFAIQGYFTSEYIEVLPTTSYTDHMAETIVFYNANKNFISQTGGSKTFITPANAVFLRLSSPNSNLDLEQVELGNSQTSYEGYGFHLKNLIFNVPTSGETSESSTRDRLYTFKDAWIQWENGSKFPVGFLGDSTTDGSNTTGWDYPVGHDQLDTNAGGTGKVDYVWTKAYPYLLEQLIRKETGSTTARIYNIGYAGTQLTWAKPKLDAMFSGAYADVKMVGIQYGINDRVGPLNTKDYESSFRTNLEYFINWFYDKGIQPFLVTSQATNESSPETTFIATQPLRSAEAINSVTNRVKKELAVKYNLELIDLNKFDELLLTYSQYTMIQIMGNSDPLHFGDLGHQLEAGFLFSKFCPRVIEFTENEVLGFTSQRMKSKIPTNKITYLNPIDNGFKIKTDYVKETTADLLIQDFWVLNVGRNPFSVTAYAKAMGATYVKVNDVVTILSSLTQTLSNLDIGLHHIQAYTGTSTTANFMGFKLEKVTS